MKVFFDVDGVLVDGWHARPERRNPWDATIEQDLGIDREAFQREFFGPPRRLMHTCARGDRDLKEALAEVLPGIGYDGSVGAVIDYWLEKDTNVNQGVLGVVKRLGRHADVELYLATGQEHYRAAYLWNDLGFRELFREMFYSAELGRLKNEPEFFLKINAALEIEPDERPLYFDDQPTVVELARKIGWDACLFDRIDDLIKHPRLRMLLTGR